MRLGKLLDDAKHFDYETVRQVGLRTHSYIGIY
jgi:hypothetical protein